MNLGWMQKKAIIPARLTPTLTAVYFGEKEIDSARLLLDSCPEVVRFSPRQQSFESETKVKWE